MAHLVILIVKFVFPVHQTSPRYFTSIVVGLREIYAFLDILHPLTTPFMANENWAEDLVCFGVFWGRRSLKLEGDMGCMLKRVSPWEDVLSWSAVV
ncbi:MAG: hypothetical protein QG552_1233 [Thermodesulfobacteriota bacterium]|nr:hypothetical protein [Thermodesulfobacteriota bacterium]